MLANYRCSEIKQNILKENEEKIKNFQKESSEKEIDDFKQKCLDIKDYIINEYNKTASNLIPKVEGDSQNTKEENKKDNKSKTQNKQNISLNKRPKKKNEVKGEDNNSKEAFIK